MCVCEKLTAAMENRRVALALLVVTAVVLVGMLQFRTASAECDNRDLELAVPQAAFEMTRTADGLRFRHAGGDRIATTASEGDFLALEVRITGADGGRAVVAWDELADGSYPVDPGDTATLQRSRVPVDPGPGAELAVVWRGYNGAISDYCDRYPWLSDREPIEEQFGRWTIDERR